MKTYNVTVPEIGIVAATRGMAGAGAGLLSPTSCRGTRDAPWAGRFWPSAC
jgi:hypothetical protein